MESCLTLLFNYYRPLKRLSGCLLLASLWGCAPANMSVPGAVPEFPDLIPFKRLDSAFRYQSRGYGNDLQGRLLLIGPEEVLRWNAEAGRFERFGGAVPGASDGKIQRDSAGNLYLISSQTHYVMTAGETSWKKLDTELPALTEPGQSYSGAGRRLLIDAQGAQWLLASVNENNRRGTVFYHRDSSTAPLRKVAQTWSDTPNTLDPGETDRFGLRKDGMLFYQTPKGLLGLSKDANTPQPVLNCQTSQTDHCQPGLRLVTSPHSQDVYLTMTNSGEITVYKLPATGAFPLVPTTLAPMPGEGIPIAGMIEFHIDGQNRLWGFRNQESGVTVSRPPYILDVTTANRLEGSSWKQVGRFLTPFYAWGLSHDGSSAYTYGKQTLGGGLNGTTEISEARLP